MARIRIDHPAHRPHPEMEWRLWDLWRPEFSGRWRWRPRSKGSPESIEDSGRIIFSELPTRYWDDAQALGRQMRNLERVALECDSARVSVPAVELNHHAGVPPQQIDLMSVDPDVGLEPSDTSLA